MRINRIAYLGFAMVLPLAAKAELPFSKQGFGQVQATLDFCIQQNETEAPKYKEFAKRLILGTPGREIEEARGSEEYQKAYKSTATELAKLSKTQANEACAGLLEDKK